MIKQITTFTNLKNKYGWLNGSYLFFTRYISRNKYYAILIEKLKQEFRTEIEDIKITSKSCSNNKLDEMNTCIIWILWYQGYEKMPKLVKKCYNSLLENVKSDKYKIILLDKPVTGLDPQVTQEFYGLLKSLNEQGMTIVMVSHDLSVLKYATHVLYLKKKVPIFMEKEMFIERYGKEIYND